MQLQVGVEDIPGPYPDVGVEIVGEQQGAGGGGVVFQRGGDGGEVVILVLTVGYFRGAWCRSGEKSLDNLVDVDGVRRYVEPDAQRIVAA